MNVAEYLLHPYKNSNRLALLTVEREYSFHEIWTTALKISDLLQKSNSKPADRIILLADSSFFWVTVYLGIILSGRVCVPLNTTVNAKKLEKIIRLTEPAMMFIQTKYAHKYLLDWDLPFDIILDINSSRLPLYPDWFEKLGSIPVPSAGNTVCNVDPNKDLASIFFTSGTTGEPRGVMVTHSNIIANTESIINYLNLTCDDRIMAVLPFYYCFGTSLLHTHLRVGGSIVVDNRFMFPEVILNRMLETSCTGFAGVPSTFQILLRNSTLKDKKFPKLRYVQQAGGKLPDIFIHELRKALPETKIFVMYGQTEATARLSYLPPDLIDIKQGSIGKGIPGVTLEVLDEKEAPVPPGATGEIVARGKNIALGYWKSPDATAGTFRNGKLFTGDLARIDEDGYIYIIDRAKDFLKCGGHRISSKEIEEEVLNFPGVVEAAVVGQSDEKLGEAVRLYIVHPDGEGIQDQLKGFLGKKLEWSFIPRKIIFLKTLPKFSSGKINKSLLKPEVFDKSK